MSKILSTAVAMPPNNISQSQARDFARSHFDGRAGDLDRLLPIFENSRIDNRQFCMPIDWYMSPKSFKEKNDAYIEWACRLGVEAVEKCLTQVNIKADEIDHIIFVSSTGISTPSIDARLFNLLKFRSNISRIPVWGLGCVGGACGLSFANDYIRAYPKSKVLLVVIELCGLTFHYSDYSKSNLVAMALFADGVGAVLLGGQGDGIEILDSQSTIWPDSLDIMGWNLLDEGLQVVFARAIPGVVRKYTRNDITGFLARHNLNLHNIKHFLFHPGGAKVIDAYNEALSLTDDDLSVSAEVLKNHGNMSAATLIYVIDYFGKKHTAANSDYGLMTALGPGFSAQTLLFRS
jgi:alkylresorcinol/alkylpyrone synthase